jgi:hypothetical protein
VALAGSLAAVSAWLFAAWADVDGPNYDGWGRALVAFVFVALAAVAVALVAMPKLSARRIAFAAGGVLVAVICAFVTIHWFGDGHPTTWIASVLAWLGFLGLSVVAGALSLPSLRRQRLTSG